jgi:uroporphyrinogen decarboxylase
MDAAIIFADILSPLMGMGLELSFGTGSGPVISNPIHNPNDVDKLTTPAAAATMPATIEAIKLVVDELKPKNIPLIGFGGAPFTLAAYAIEGSSSKNHTKTKQFMYHEPAAWAKLMNKLVAIQTDFLLAQAQAGASALQVFDSGAGVLSKLDYIRYVFPYTQQLIAQLGRAGVPIINFSTGTSAYLDVVAGAGGDVIGVDWQLPLEQAWDMLGEEQAIMGNLDPAWLLAPWSELKNQVDTVLEAANGRHGHIFNLGHGVLPQTEPDTVRRVVDYVHEQTNL